MPACGLRPAAWLRWGPSAAHLHRPKLKTLTRGQASRGGRHKASSGAASPGRLARRRRDQGKWYLARLLMMQAMTIVTADGEADYGMPNTEPILRCHLRRRVLSLHCEEQQVII